MSPQTAPVRTASQSMPFIAREWFILTHVAVFLIFLLTLLKRQQSASYVLNRLLLKTARQPTSNLVEIDSLTLSDTII